MSKRRGKGIETLNEACRYKEFSLLYKLTYKRIIMNKCISNTIQITGTIHKNVYPYIQCRRVAT